MAEIGKKYRLVTRSDIDGLACAVLLKEMGLIGEITFVHPKDMQDGLVEITDMDITTNLPYVEGAHLVFDHHSSEVVRTGDKAANLVLDPDAPSTARVVYDHYGGSGTFRPHFDAMMEAVDKADSAAFAMDDVKDPKGWVLLSFLMDARTGLGRFRSFTISNYALMMNLIDLCKDFTIDEILKLPDVKERVDLYFEQQAFFKDQLMKCASVHGNVVVLDLKNEETIYAGNRFMIYVLNPQCGVSIHSMWGVRKQNSVFTVGKSIFNKSSEADIGEIMLRYGGGGHRNAGTCQVANGDAERTLKELIAAFNA
ncbi:MAG: exopolyphosphatase [Oscillospiraceae bacterium]|nr:exopolyphosphatase [Oscillospiraceae bacterium]